MVDQAPAEKTDSTILNSPTKETPTQEQKLYDKDASDEATKAKEAETKTAEEKAASDKAAADKAVADKTAADKTASDKAKADAEAATKEKTQKTTTTEGKTTTEGSEKEPTADYDLKLPEGSPLSPEDLAATLKDAKDAGQSKEQAEKTLQTKDQTARAVLQRQSDLVKTIQKTWKDQVSKDPEIGGDKFTENVEIAKRAWDKLATPDLKKWADETGLGNHPEVVRLMVRVGKLISEDRLVRGAPGGAPKSRNPEDVLYGSPKSPAEAMA